MKQSLKIGFVAVVIAAVAASGLAFAQSTGGDDTVPPSDDARVEQVDGHRHRGPRGNHRGIAHVRQVAEILGIEDPREIIDALESGSTLAEVATANGSSGDALVSELVASLEERLAGAVADERIDQDRADEILGNATDKITFLVNSTQDEIEAASEAERAERQAEREARRAERQQTLEDVIGIPFEDIKAALQEGDTTLAEIAAEGPNSLSVDELVGGLLVPAEAHLAEKVADGTLTQEEADERLAQMTERLTERVQSEPGDGPGFRDGRGRRGPRPGGPRAGFGPANGAGAQLGLSA